MNRYVTETPRVAFGLASVAATVLVFALAVLLPATSPADPENNAVLVAANAMAAATDLSMLHEGATTQQ